MLFWKKNEALPFLWRNNREVLGIVTTIILLIILFLQKTNQAPLYFFRKNQHLFLKKQWGAWFLSGEIIRQFIFFRRDNKARWLSTLINMGRCFLQWQYQAPHYFFRKKRSVLLFPQKKLEHIVISTEINEALHYFFRKKSSTLLFLQKEWGPSLFLQKKKKHLIISSEKNEAPQYFFEQKWSTW